MWQPSESYPDPAIEVLDDSFAKCVLFNARVERLATGCRWSEGPVWFGDWQSLIWSDIPNNRMLRWDDQDGEAKVFRQPSNFSNGNTRDRQGRLVTCEHGTRRVTRTDHDGTVAVLMDSFEGKPLNSPNDVVVKSDGSIWFTDPPFGIASDYEGHRAEPELASNVYRLDPDSGVAKIVVGDVRGPNGLAFSPDEKTFYLVEARSAPRRILAFDVIDKGTALGSPRVQVSADDGGALDGFRVDEYGNLWCGWGHGPDLDGVMVYSPAGMRIGRIRLPERCANLAFGGRARNRLFMAASQSLYALYVNVRGA